MKSYLRLFVIYVLCVLVSQPCSNCHFAAAAETTNAGISDEYQQINPVPYAGGSVAYLELSTTPRTAGNNAYEELDTLSHRGASDGYLDLDYIEREC